VILHKSGH